MIQGYGRHIIQTWKRLILLFGQRWTRIGLAGFLLVPLFWWSMVLPTEWLDLTLLDLIRNTESRAVKPDPGILLLGIDTHTLELAQERWPWPRSTMAALLDRISQGGPRALLVDILFQHPGEPDGERGDAALGRAIEGSGRVFLVSPLREKLASQGRKLVHLRPCEPLRRKALGEGYSRAIADSDGVYRSFALFDGQVGTESVAVQVVRRFSPASSGVGQAFPDQGLISFARGGGGIPQYSAAALLDGRLSPDVFRDRIVVLGLTAPVIHDYWLTPAGIMPGAMIFAASIDTLLRGKTGVRLNSGGWRAGTLLFGMLLSLAFSGIPFTARGWGRPLAFLGCGAAGLFLAVWTGRYPPFGLWLLAWLWMTMVWFAIERFLEFVDFQAIRVEGVAARAIQQRIYPSGDWRDPRGFDCRALVIPCDEVGGDYVDFQALPDGSLVFIMADVAGHGYSASLVTVVAKTCTTLMGKWDLLNASNLALTLNSLLFDLLKKRRMMTALIGHLNPEDGRLTLVFNGHVPGYHVRADGRVEEIGMGSYPLGMKWELKVKTRELVLEPGGTLVLYTDGISEAIDWNKEPYGFDAWIANLSRVVPGLGPEAPLEEILKDVRRHTDGRPFGDDVALMVVRRLPGGTREGR